MLYRWTPPVDAPGHQTFTLPLKREWGSKPLALVAFQNGGQAGVPAFGCGDLPVIAP